VLEAIGEGGQGDVFRVTAAGEPARALKRFRFDPGAEGEEQRARFRREVSTLSAIDDPGILRLYDADQSEGWMVTDLHRGTLESDFAVTAYKGFALAALEAIRPVVRALATVHGSGGVHRDIAPKNVFVSFEGALVVGDFGLFFDPKAERVTRPKEGVGTRYYIAPWVDRKVRFEEWPPSADVYALGKVLWYMVAGGDVLHYWYHDEPQFDLEERFPDQIEMRWINRVLAATVVEKKEKCLASAKEMLDVVDRAIAALKRGGVVLRESEPWPCSVCGLGMYRAAYGGEAAQFALPTPGKTHVYSSVGHLFGGRVMTVKIYSCDNCENVQMFWYRDGNRPKGWHQRAPKSQT
jgi:serine/threonine protein kinase